MVGLVILIIAIASLAPSTGRIEKMVLNDIREERDIDAIDLKLIKMGKGYYTGILRAETIFGTTGNFKIEVFTDGRSIKWELNY